MNRRLIKLLKFEKYHIFTRPYELNIVGLRSNNTKANAFDDELHIFYTLPNGKRAYHVFSITTDAGTFWLKNPIIPKGTALLKAGQYVNAYGIALHQGRYTALCQIHKPVTVVRDYDRNATLDFFNGVEETGMFGINIHRALSTGKTKEIDRFSAGCQVFSDSRQFDLFMQLCQQHKSLYGNRFTYTLLDFRSKRRQYLRWITYGLSTIGLGALGYWFYQESSRESRASTRHKYKVEK